MVGGFSEKFGRYSPSQAISASSGTSNMKNLKLKIRYFLQSPKTQGKMRP